MRVTVIGLGLIGGSFALALRSKGIATELIGVESSPQHAAKALELGIVDSVQPLQQAIEDERKYAEDILAGKFIVDDLKDKPLYEAANVAPTRSRQKCTTTHTPLFKNIPARYSGPNRRVTSKESSAKRLRSSASP